MAPVPSRRYMAYFTTEIRATARVALYLTESFVTAFVILAYYSARKDYRIIRELNGGHGFAAIRLPAMPTYPARRASTP